MTTDSKRADQLLDLALRHARTIRVVIGELAKLNAERELRIIRRQLADLTRRAEPAPKAKRKQRHRESHTPVRIHGGNTGKTISLALPRSK